MAFDEAEVVKIKCYEHWSEGPSYADFPNVHPGEIAYCMGDWRWRVANLYTVVSKEGQIVPFRPNRAQKQFIDNIHGTDIVLKARQLGFSTLIEIIILDSALFHKNFACGIITITLPDGVKLLKEKVLDVYDRLPEALRTNHPLKTRSGTLVEFENGSSITVGISLRGGTYQLVHVSELGKISARFPARAQEIKTGAFNTIAKGQHIFVESTAEGKNYFHDLVMEANGRDERGEAPEQGEFKLHFFPWFDDPEYAITSRQPLTKYTKTYFKALQKETKRVFSKEQVNWYQRKRAQQGAEMKREYPSTIKEAFEASIEGAIFRHEIARVYDQQRVGDFPYLPELGPVYTAWDIGRSDHTVILLLQRIGVSLYNIFDCIYNFNTSLPWYIDELMERKHQHNFTWGKHMLPHDGVNHEFMTIETRQVNISNALMSPAEIVARAKSISGDIDACRSLFEGTTWHRFNDGSMDPLRGGASHALEMMQSYRWKNDERLGTFTDKDEHDDASHFAAAFRTLAGAHRLNLFDDGEFGPTEELGEVHSPQTASGYM